MKSYLPSAVLGITLTAAAIGFGAATAHASSYTNESAAQASSELQAMGYSVQFNGTTNGNDLSRCTVTGVEGLTAGTAFGTAYIDLSCPSDD